jgi:hypothetical protein
VLVLWGVVDHVCAPAPLKGKLETRNQKVEIRKGRKVPLLAGARL